jgi:hypothetical protein
MSGSILERPEVRFVLFHPRRDHSPCPPGVQPVSIPLQGGLSAGGRLYPAGPRAPAILFFHGNGEVAADYDDIAPLYGRIGITLLVMDYRGYGTSGGTPTARALLDDAVTVLERLGPVLDSAGLSPARLYLMGRSLGSVADIEAALHAQDRLAGLVVESGLADTWGLLARMGARVDGAHEARDEFDNGGMSARIHIPTLVVHGQNDVLIPAEDGRELYRRSGAQDKRLVIIPGAGHNDLLWTGRTAYFDAIRDLVRPQEIRSS